MAELIYTRGNSKTERCLRCGHYGMNHQYACLVLRCFCEKLIPNYKFELLEPDWSPPRHRFTHIIRPSSRSGLLQRQG